MRLARSVWKKQVSQPTAPAVETVPARIGDSTGQVVRADGRTRHTSGYAYGTHLLLSSKSM